jgi:hypothetical protein
MASTISGLSDSDKRRDDGIHDDSDLICIGLSLPDIQLIAIVVRTFIKDLKRGRRAAGTRAGEGDTAVSEAYSASAADADDSDSVDSLDPSSTNKRLPRNSFSAAGTSAEAIVRRTSKQNLLISTSHANLVQMQAMEGAAAAAAAPTPPPPAAESRPPPTNYFDGVPTNLQVLVGLSNMRVAFVNNVMGIPLLSALIRDASTTVSRVPKLEGLAVDSVLTIQGT